jgi:predicted RNase H-like HicB family nuclease
MEAYRFPIRMVFYKEEKSWIAHCLEMDVVGHGRTKAAARKMLTEAIDCQILTSIKFNNPRNIFMPADGKFFAMFAAGKDVEYDRLKFIKNDSITIQDVTAREYSDSHSNLLHA